MNLKIILKKILTLLHIDATKNMQYDRLTNKILKSELREDSNCIDIGSHRGEILELFIQYASKGRHFAFEPVPFLFEGLTEKYSLRARISSLALSDIKGEANFKYVKNAPAYSGLQTRKYDIKHPVVEDIFVQVNTLDEVIPEDLRLDLVKIDVEGAEFHVLKGGRSLLKKWKPVIIFECGLGASDYYKTDPGELFDFICGELDMKLYTLPAYANGKKVLNHEQFTDIYWSNSEYYFVAAE